MTNTERNLLRLVAEAADLLLIAHAQAADTNTVAALRACSLARQIETATTAMDVECELAEAHAAPQSVPQAAQPSGGHVGADSGTGHQATLSGPGNGVSE